MVVVLTDEQVERYKEVRSIIVLGKEIGLSQSCVWNALRRQGIDTGYILEDLSDEDIERYKNGATAKALAKENGISPGTVASILKRRKIHIRSSSEYPPRESPYRINLPNAEIVSRYIGGESIKMLSREFSVDETAIKCRLKRNNIKIRTGKASVCHLVGNRDRSIMFSAKRQGIPISEWREFSTTIWERASKLDKWKQWRTSVFKRDNWKCFFCGDKGRLKTNPLHPHHIYPKRMYPERVYDINNGITVCKRHHAWMNGKEYAYAPMFDIYLAQFNVA